MAINRLISHLICHAFYLLVVLLSTFNPNNVSGTLDLDWYDYALPVLSFTYLVEDIRLIRYSKKHRSSNVRYMYDFLLHLLMLLGALLMAIGYAQVCWDDEKDILEAMKDCTHDDPTHESFDKFRSLVFYGYGCHGIGLVLIAFNSIAE